MSKLREQTPEFASGVRLPIPYPLLFILHLLPAAASAFIAFQLQFDLFFEVQIFIFDGIR